MFFKRIIQFKVVLKILMVSVCSSAFGQIDPIDIFNSLLDTVYIENYCGQVIYPPNFHCCACDTFKLLDCYKYCDSLNIPKENRILCKQCISYKDKKLYKFIAIADDSLFTLDLDSSSISFLKKVLPNDSVLIQFLNDEKIYSNSIAINVSDLQNGEIKFMTRNKVTGVGYRTGKYGEYFIDAGIKMSSIYYSEKFNIGIFDYWHYGGNNCGYISYILFRKENNVWELLYQVNHGAY